MKTLFLLILFGVLQPTSPHYDEYIKDHGNVIVDASVVHETEEDCEEAKAAAFITAAEYDVEVLFTKCEPFPFNPATKGATDESIRQEMARIVHDLDKSFK